MTNFVTPAISPRLSRWAWGFKTLKPLERQVTFLMRQRALGLARGVIITIDTNLRRRLWEQLT